MVFCLLFIDMRQMTAHAQCFSVNLFILIKRFLNRYKTVSLSILRAVGCSE